MHSDHNKREMLFYCEKESDGPFKVWAVIGY